jgi:hypothetical protein
MNWIYEAESNHGRIVVGIDRIGITIRQWDEAIEEEGYHYQEAIFAWSEYKKPLRSIELNGVGRTAVRIAERAAALLANHGASSDSCGIVPDTRHRYDCGYLMPSA